VLRTEWGEGAHLDEATYDSGRGGRGRARILEGRDIGGPEKWECWTPKASNVKVFDGFASPG